MTWQDKALTTATKMAEQAKARAADELLKAKDLGDIRIDGDLIQQARARAENLGRPDVPRATSDGQAVPEDLRDEFNIMYRDANGQLMASNYLVEDFTDDAKPSPSPAEPILNAREFLPVLATVPLMALVIFHWIFGVIAILAYTFLARREDRGFWRTFKYIMVGRSWWGLPLAALFFGILFLTPGWFAAAVLPLWQYMRAANWLSNFSPMETGLDERAKRLHGQAQHLTRTGYATQTYLEDQMHVLERQRQADAAVADPMPVLDIGARATGYFTAHGGLNSPDEGKHMLFTGNDLGAGALVVGTTGTGKTYTVLTPLMYELARVNLVATDPAERYGLMLMDDKGDLPPRGMAIFKDFALISPEPFVVKGTGEVIPASPFAPMEGLNAEQVAMLIGDIFNATGEIWDKAAQEKFLYTLVLMECARDMRIRKAPVLEKAKKPVQDKDGKTIEWIDTGVVFNIKWNLETLFRLVLTDTQTASLMRCMVAKDASAKAQGLPRPMTKHPLIDTAMRYFMENYNKLAENTRSSVQFNVSAWHTDSVNRHMRAWWECETGVRIEEVYAGRAMGLYCPEFRYGVTGKLVATMVRARLYNFAKNRSSSWEEGGTRAVLMWDEFALGIGKGEMESNILPIQRSLGLTSIWATQTITEVEARMGRDRAHALLDNLAKNVICLATDPNSYDYLAKKMGTYRKFVPADRSKEQPVAIDYFGTHRAKHLTGLDGVEIFDVNRLESRVLEPDATHQFRTVQDEDAYVRWVNAGLLAMEEGQVFDPAEMSRLLNFKFYAFMAMQRGGAPRYDVVHLGNWTKPEVAKVAEVTEETNAS